MKYFTKEVKIALTAIVAIILLFIGLNFLKGINVFQSTQTYYVKFKDINGLVVSNSVFANGYPVGIVRTIDYDYERGEHVVVGIEVDDDMRIPNGTRAELEAELMGGVRMNLVLGPNPTDNLAPGDTIGGAFKQGLMTKAEDLLPAIEKMLPKLDSIMDNLNRLTGDPALKHTLANAEAMTGDLRKTAARLDEMMQGDIPQMLGRFNRASANLETLSARLADVDVAATMSSVNQTLDSAQQLIDKLDTKMSSKDNTLGLFLNDRSVYENLDATLAHADSLMIDLKAHPKRYVHFSVFGKKDK